MIKSLSNGIVLTVALCAVGLGCGMLGAEKNAAIEPANNAVTPAPSAETTSTAEQSGEAAALMNEKNLLAFGSGTIFAKKPAEFSAGGAGAWSAFALIDERNDEGWAKKLVDGGAGDVMVLEMSERSELKTFVFDTKSTEPQTTARNITVEVSDTSATEGFTEVVKAELKEHADGQVFKASAEMPARWVRLTIKDNYGSPEYTEIMEMRAFGKQLTQSTLPNVSGTYEMEQYGPMHIKQDGTSVIGCYEFSNGTIEGGVEDRVMRLKWEEGNEDLKTDRKGGPAIMVFSPDGKVMTGAYGHEGGKAMTGVWNGKKVSSDVGKCPHMPGLSGSNVAKDTIGADLKETGRAKVYGINFDFNSDVIRNESRATLNQIVAILKENADWKMMVEGHTDSVGGEAYNKTLSEKRAASVRAFLVSAGIDAARLTSSGLGMSKPVAENTSEFGRAQNRRVELVKQ